MKTRIKQLIDELAQYNADLATFYRYELAHGRSPSVHDLHEEIRSERHAQQRYGTNTDGQTQAHADARADRVVIVEGATR